MDMIVTIRELTGDQKVWESRARISAANIAAYRASESDGYWCEGRNDREVARQIAIERALVRHWGRGCSFHSGQVWRHNHKTGGESACTYQARLMVVANT